MKRTILAVFSALVTWIIVVSILDRVLRYGFNGYAAAEPVFAFTLGMQLARLAMAALASLAAGAVAARIAPHSTQAPWITGVILLAAFLPTHVQLWQRFPLWYHLSFLLTLVPLVMLGARWLRARASVPAAPAAV